MTQEEATSHIRVRDNALAPARGGTPAPGAQDKPFRFKELNSTEAM